MIEPRYQSERVTLYCADCLDVLPQLTGVDVVVTDPPYGIDYHSGHDSSLPRSIAGDLDTSVRDAVLLWWPGPALVFGTWRATRPISVRMVLIWDTMGALGMGDLSLPWKPAHQEIYVIGRGFIGRRSSDVIRFPPVQSMAKNGRVHPHEKPLGLMRMLLQKAPAGTTLDPFMGSGSTGVAAMQLGRRFIGIEIDEAYYQIAERRIRDAEAQLLLPGLP